MSAEINANQGDSLSPTQVTEMDKLLEEFEDLFKEPTRLPPSRKFDHAILVKEGYAPAQSKFYRYPHSQKEEIEKERENLLDGGEIQYSCSQFPSPMILVKKQDRTWRMCVTPQLSTKNEANLDIII